ncbi:hypothetical protein PG993_013222 [Apiospora rasikravindrae]|uniref:Isopenicillin N synthase-like Fe(2+) 2OG dioxygenase domain-containing protein n=1 Tax=Apiospora rasikravindrae TaxID=990691 RepID=A0ABR1RX15_9PEZI
MQKPIETINYEAILNKDTHEVDKLRKACRPPPIDKGIFYLDLTGPSGKQVLLDLPKIDQGILSYFGQPADTKMKDYREGVERGFKHPGEVIETFEINRIEMLEAPRDLPWGFQSCKDEIASMLDSGHHITKTLLEALDVSPDLAPGSRRPVRLGPQAIPPGWRHRPGSRPKRDGGAAHRHGPPDAAVVRRALPRAPRGEGKEGDGGMTWATVEPMEGCVVVHVGDAFQEASGSALLAPIHRVVQPESPPPGGTPMVVYFLRPQHPIYESSPK